MPSPTLRPDQYLTVSRAYHPIPLPDGSLVLASDIAGHPNVYALDRPGAWPRRLAASSERTLPVAATRHGLLLRHDTGGDERWQLSLLAPDGRVRPLTSDPLAMHVSPTLSPDGDRVGLAYNPGGGIDLELGVLDLRTGELSRWLAPGGFVEWGAWRPDGKQIAALRRRGSGRQEAYLFEPGGQLARVLPSAHAVSELKWTPDGRLLAVTDFESEFLGVAELDPRELSKPKRWLLHPDHDVEVAELSADGETLACAVREGFRDALLLVGTRTGEVRHRFGLPAGTLYADNVDGASNSVAFAPHGGLLVAWETPTAPAEIYSVRPEAEPVRLTFAGPDLAGLVDPRERTYRSFDDLEVPALHFRVDGSPRPTVVWIHGGPESQLVANFSPYIQLLCSQGLDVLAPNVRGSSGYGVTYLHLDDREKRWDSVRDACEAARHLKREGLATRTAAMGASYGGFMTLAVLVDDPELWDAAVDIVGIADWRSFFKNTSGWRRALRTSEYGDPDIPEDAEFLDRFSPLRRAAEIKAPLLVLHGRNDPRVPLVEAEQIRDATGAELLVFDDEGHGLMRHGNRVRGYGRAAEFLAEKLSPPPVELD